MIERMVDLLMQAIEVAMDIQQAKKLDALVMMAFLKYRQRVADHS